MLVLTSQNPDFLFLFFFLAMLAPKNPRCTMATGGLLKYSDFESAIYDTSKKYPLNTNQATD